MIVTKITSGFIVQKYDTMTDSWISQEFVDVDDSEYENNDGDSISPAIMGEPEPYLPFEMVQPLKVS